MNRETRTIIDKIQAVLDEMNRDQKVDTVKWCLDLDEWALRFTEEVSRALLADDPAPAAPGGPQALELAAFLESKARAMYLKGTETSGYIRNTESEWLNDAADILRLASGPDLDALEKAMREGARVVLDFYDHPYKGQATRLLEAAVMEMRRMRKGYVK